MLREPRAHGVFERRGDVALALPPLFVDHQISPGAVSATQAFWWGRLEVEESRLPQLDALFAAPPPFTHELDCY